MATSLNTWRQYCLGIKDAPERNINYKLNDPITTTSSPNSALTKATFEAHEGMASVLNTRMIELIITVDNLLQKLVQK